MRWTIRTKLTALVLAVLLPLMAGAGVKFLARGRARPRECPVRHDRVRERRRAALRRDADRANREPRGARRRARARPYPQVKTWSTPPPGSSGITSLCTGLSQCSPMGRSPPPVTRPVPCPRRRLPRAMLSGQGSTIAGLTSERPSRARRTAARWCRSWCRFSLAAGLPSARLAAEIDLAALSAYLDRVPLMHGTSAAIVTGSGMLVARTGATPASLGRTLQVPGSAESLIRERRASRSGGGTTG